MTKNKVSRMRMHWISYLISMKMPHPQKFIHNTPHYNTHGCKASEM